MVWLLPLTYGPNCRSAHCSRALQKVSSVAQIQQHSSIHLFVDDVEERVIVVETDVVVKDVMLVDVCVAVDVVVVV